MLKRLLDVTAAGLGLLLLSPLLAVVALLVKLTSPGPALFRQERVGRGGKPFFILKFRSMVADAPNRGGQITYGADPRITTVGRLIRKTKIDELPQLLNVLRGEMSLVGPRPEVRKYVDMFAEDYEEILRVRPGITDLASVKYRDEAAILGAAADPEQEYVERVLPEKIRLAREYVRRQSLLLDLGIIFGTLFHIARDAVARRRDSAADESNAA
ncbi:MAG: sugar transferase [Planctomycetes bacterium]|nr:sugar transferase [Planctomycetota bacterium]